MDFVELYELQHRIRESLEEALPDRVWVRAEVAQIQQKSNGHCYLDLCQSDGKGLVAKVRAVIWRGTYASVARSFHAATGSPIQPGITILALACVNYSELYGLSLVIEDIEPQFTLGEAEMARRRTIAGLEADGLMDRQKKLVPAVLPYNLAVISARDAAGYGDFCRHLRENEYGFVFRVTLIEAVMQGPSAPESISDALALAESSVSGYDAVLILRGGGSALDLACFDDYSLCAAIACCGLPVFTAVGHDRDCHVADMVSYASVKTPTALADVFISAFEAEDERISSAAARLRMAFSERISRMESDLATVEARISTADPRNLLSRGYTLVTDAAGVLVKSSAELKTSDRIKVLFKDGTIEAEVK